jgi:hypothetical protein
MKWAELNRRARESSLEQTITKFKGAVAQAGGRNPLDAGGQPMRWNEARGWHPRAGSRGPARMAERRRRQEDAERAIAAFDRAIIREWQAGHRAGSDSLVRGARQREVARELAASRMRLLGRS